MTIRQLSIKTNHVLPKGDKHGGRGLGYVKTLILMKVPLSDKLNIDVFKRSTRRSSTWAIRTYEMVLVIGKDEC